MRQPLKLLSKPVRVGAPCCCRCCCCSTAVVQNPHARTPGIPARSEMALSCNMLHVFTDTAFTQVITFLFSVYFVFFYVTKFTLSTPTKIPLFSTHSEFSVNRFLVRNAVSVWCGESSCGMGTPWKGVLRHGRRGEPLSPGRGDQCCASSSPRWSGQALPVCLAKPCGSSRTACDSAVSLSSHVWHVQTVQGHWCRHS